MYCNVLIFLHYNTVLYCTVLYRPLLIWALVTNWALTTLGNLLLL